MRTKNYLAPEIEVISVELESGIAQSGNDLPAILPGGDEDW